MSYRFVVAILSWVACLGSVGAVAQANGPEPLKVLIVQPKAANGLPAARFELEGIDAQIAVPVFRLMETIRLTATQPELCFDTDPACKLGDGLRDRLLHKRPQKPDFVESLSMNRLSDLMLLRLMSLEDKALANLAAKLGIFSTYDDIRRDRCIPKPEMDLYITFLGALSWRARGGGLYPKPERLGTFSLRTLYARQPWTLFASSYGANPSLADEVGAGMYRNLKNAWGEWIDIGRAKVPINDHTHDGTPQSDFENLTARGIEQVRLASTALRRRGYNITPLTQAGSQFGACYLYGWNLMSTVLPPEGAAGKKISPIAADGITWGEFCAGASMAYALTQTMTPTYSCGRARHF